MSYARSTRRPQYSQTCSRIVQSYNPEGIGFTIASCLRLSFARTDVANMLPNFTRHPSFSIGTFAVHRLARGARNSQTAPINTELTGSVVRVRTTPRKTSPSVALNCHVIRCRVQMYDEVSQRTEVNIYTLTGRIQSCHDAGTAVF